MIDLVLPRVLAGLTLGEAPSANQLTAYFSDGDEEDGCIWMSRFEPNVSVLICDGMAVSITTRDECWLGGLDLIGMNPSDAVETLGMSCCEVESGEVSIYHLNGGIDLYVREGTVTQVNLSDFTLVPD